MDVPQHLDFASIGPRVGDSFPDFALPDQDGVVAGLSQRRAGRPALVVFYRSASW